VTAQWQLFTADWGTQIADPQLANAWYTEALARAQAFDAATDWTTQRTTLSSAWVALGNAYRGANIPPPSDPEYRRIFREWFGKCETEPEFRRNYKVGALVSAGGGRRLAQIVARIWHDAKGDGNGQAGMIPVRLSLSSDGVVKSVCLEATGTGDCDYRGLYTGCATPAPEGIYQEHPCASVNYDANTFEWKSTEFGSASEFSMERCNVPLSVFRSVLNDLLDAWQSRGGAAGVIDQTRAFVAATNFGNAAAMGLAPAEYLTASHSAVIEAEQLSTGSNPARQTVASIMGAIATACAASANPYGAACAVVAAAIAALAQIIPVAAGIVTDQFGVPVGGDNRDAFLPAMIHGPNEGARHRRARFPGSITRGRWDARNGPHPSRRWRCSCSARRGASDGRGDRERSTLEPPAPDLFHCSSPFESAIERAWRSSRGCSCSRGHLRNREGSSLICAVAHVP
jgi:hypothetical protein